MTIDEAIENLQSGKKEGVKTIVLAWWSAADFDRNDNDDWADAAATVERKMDWSATHDNIATILSDIKSTNKTIDTAFRDLEDQEKIWRNN